MGFRDKVRGEASKTFKGLVIDDMPSGNVVLRPMLRLSDEETDRITALQNQLNDLEKTEGASLSDVRSLLVEMTLVLADKPEGLEEYLSEFDTAEMVALYRLWAKETQASESKSRK